jgi:hypothetical protein
MKEVTKTMTDEASVVESNSVSSQSMIHTSHFLKIKTMLRDLKKSNCNQIFMECLLSTMDSNPNDERIQVHCLCIINQDLLDGTIDSFLFIDMNGTYRVLDALKFFAASLEVQEIGCDILATLMTNDNDRVNLIHQDVCTSLCRIVTVHSRETNIVDKALVALRKLSTIYEARKLMIQLDLTKSVVAAMQENASSSTIQQDSCAILSNMSVDIQSNVVSVVGMSELKAIVEAMQIHCNDESVMAGACFALKNYSYNIENLRCMSRTPNMIQALERAALFESLSISSEQTLEKLYMSLAQDESIEDQAHRDLMVLISERSNDPGIVSAIIEKMKEYKWSCSVIKECLTILSSLVVSSARHKEKMIDNLTIEELNFFSNAFPSVEMILSESLLLANLY